MMLPFKELLAKYNINLQGVLHIGGSTGQERDLYKNNSAKEVIWIEAIPPVYKKLIENIHGYSNQSALLACIGDEDGKVVTFNISNNEAQSSSFLQLGHHTSIHPEVHYVQQLDMKMQRVDTLFNSLNKDISNFNFLNIDLQGAELMALKGMGSLLKQFDYAILELNKKETYIGCALVDDIDVYMLQNGFERVETGEWVGDTWTDGFYIKRELL